MYIACLVNNEEFVSALIIWITKSKTTYVPLSEQHKTTYVPLSKQHIMVIMKKYR